MGFPGRNFWNSYQSRNVDASASTELSSRRNDLDSVPSEPHRHLTRTDSKNTSFSKIGFKFIRDSFKRKGKSSGLQIFEGAHDPKDELMVNSFRELLLLERQLPERHNDYHTLLRFLRMRSYDMLKAKDMYLKMLKWRHEFSVDIIAQEFEFNEYEDVKRCYPQGFHGVDRYGRPLYIERIGMIDLTSLLQVTTIDRYVKYHIFEQEKTLNRRYPACSVAAQRHIVSTTSILDVKGVGMHSFSKPARDIFLEIQKIDSNYYPETLHRLYIINAGPGFRALWRALKAFLEARTLAKITVLGSEYRSKLLEDVDASNLPVFLGGKCACAEFGGCLSKDKGPWNNPEIIDKLQVLSDGWLDPGSEETSVNVSSDNGPILQEAIQFDERLLQKILVLEAELEKQKQILDSLVMKGRQLRSCVTQLKELTVSRSNEI